MTATIDHKPPESGEPWATPSYCSACHQNHPGPCGCACHQPAASGRPAAPTPEQVTDYWTDALKYHATGRTAGNIREQAGNPGWVAGLAYIDGITPEAERYAMITTADCMDALTAAGITPGQAYGLAGLDRILGVPFADFTPALLSEGTAPITAGAGHCLRCGAGIPAGTFYCDPCAAVIEGGSR